MLCTLNNHKIVIDCDDKHLYDGAMGQNKLVVSRAEWALGGNLCGKGLLFTKHSELG